MAMSDNGPAKTILIVEDDEIARVGLSSILRAQGYYSLAVGNGQEALDHLHAGPCPDLILLDMILPDFDGWRFIAQKQQDPSIAAIPVIVMTGLGIASKEWAVAMGAVDFLRKPVDVDFLLETVRRHVEPNGVPQ
jgi:two-component system response regulator MprA